MPLDESLMFRLSWQNQTGGISSTIPSTLVRISSPFKQAAKSVQVDDRNRAQIVGCDLQLIPRKRARILAYTCSCLTDIVSRQLNGPTRHEPAAG